MKTKKDEKQPDKFRIAVLDDNLFYNKLLFNHIKNYFDEYGLINNCVFSVKSYVNTYDFIENLSEKTDVVLLDFFLENGENAIHVIEQIKQKCPDCKVIVISGVRNIDTYYKTYWLGAVDFVYKDKSAPLRACRLIESIYAEKSAAMS